MEGNELRRALVRAAVRKGVQDVRREPDRALRRLSDLGAHFSAGETQRRLYAMLQTQLIGQDSAFHELALRAVRTTRTEYFEQFGVNLGYNSWTMGAKIIRAQGAQRGHHIPWCLTLDMRGEIRYDVNSVLRQAEALGVFCFALYGNEHIGGLFPILRQRRESAFFLLLSSAQLPAVNLENVPNVLPLLPLEDANTPAAARELAQNRCCYGLWTRYDKENVQHILSGEAEKTASACGATLLCAVAAQECTQQTQEAVRAYCETTYRRARNGCLLVDLHSVRETIDRNISGGSALMTILPDGTVRTEQRHWTDLDLYDSKLADVLKRVMPQKNKE